MTWAAIGVTVATTAAGAISGSMGADAAEGAAGISAEAAQLGINEIKAALPPSMLRLAKAQSWSDDYLRRMYHQSMAETRPYAQSGGRGLARMNYLMGLDNGLGPQPTAPTAPKQPKALKPPKYDKDPKKAAAQKAQYDQAVVAQRKAYEKAQRVYGRAKTKYEADTAAWQAGTTAQQNDPEYGSLMKPYEDTHGYGQRILDTAAEKYDDKYANEILGISRDTFEADDFETDPGYEFRRSEGSRGIEQSAAAGGSLQSGASLKALTRFNQDTASDEYGKAFSRWSDEHNRHLAGVTGQQGFDYGAWADNKGTRLNALGGERAFDYGVFGDNRDFQYGALNNMVGVGQDATDDRSRERQLYSTGRTQNALHTAETQGNWQQGSAAQIAELLGQKGNAQAAGQVGAANAYTNAFQNGGNMLAYYYGANGAGGVNGRSNPPYQPGGRTPSGGRYAPDWYQGSPQGTIVNRFPTTA